MGCSLCRVSDHNYTRCPKRPGVGSRTSEILLEAATRLEKYRALTAEYAPRKET